MKTFRIAQQPALRNWIDHFLCHRFATYSQRFSGPVHPIPRAVRELAHFLGVVECQMNPRRKTFPRSTKNGVCCHGRAAGRAEDCTAPRAAPGYSYA